MKYWLFFLSFFITSSVFAECTIDQQRFGVSSQTIENKLTVFKTYDPIPNVQKQIITVFENVCPELEEALVFDTNLYYHFIKNRLVAIELERARYDDLILFDWARQYFGIVEDRKIDEEQQLIQVEESNRVIQLYISIQPDVVYQNVLIISNQHVDLFEWLAQKEDEIDWENFEIPESKTSEEEN